MSTRKYQRKARSPKAVRPAEEPFHKVNIEDKRQPRTTYKFDLTERSDMITMKAKEAAPPSLESKLALFGEQGAGSSGLQILMKQLELAQPTPAHGASNSSGDEGRQTQDGQVALNYLLPGDTGTAPAPPVLVQIGSQSQPKEEEVTDDRGKAPMMFTTKTAELTPPSLNDCCNSFPNPVPTESDLGAHKTGDLSEAPDGSLIHTLYMQLQVAGDEGMTTQELLASFKKEKAWKSFESDWENEVQFHLENNPHVHQVKKYRLCYDGQPDLQRQPNPTANVSCMGPMIAPDTACDLELSLGRNPQWNIEYPAPPPRATKPAVNLELFLGTALQNDIGVLAPLPRATRQLFSMDHHKGVPNRKVTCEEEREAVLTQLATELEKTHIQQTAVYKPMPWWLAEPPSSQQATRMLLPELSMKRKCSSDGNEQLPELVCGCLQKQHAGVLAKQGYPMINVSCSRRDVRENWSGPSSAMEGGKFCEHHLEKRARYMADEGQMIDSLDSNGSRASQMHSMGLAEVLAEQLAEFIVIFGRRHCELCEVLGGSQRCQTCTQSSNRLLPGQR